MRNMKFVAMIFGGALLIGSYILCNSLYPRDIISTMNPREKMENQNIVESANPKNVAGEVEKGERNAKTIFAFTLNDVNGVSHSLSDYRGKKVYLKYWASWCPICLGGMEEFEQLVKNNADAEKTVILSVVSPGAFGEKSVAGFSKWYKEQGYTIPVLLDERGMVARKIGVRAFPTSVYIDSDGGIVSITPGEVSNDRITKNMQTFQ